MTKSKTHTSPSSPTNFIPFSGMGMRKKGRQNLIPGEPIFYVGGSSTTSTYTDTFTGGSSSTSNPDTLDGGSSSI
jgi:hypothetical protein